MATAAPLVARGYALGLHATSDAYHALRLEMLARRDARWLRAPEQSTYNFELADVPMLLRSQEEFFHTFNELLEGQHQVILTCDRYPKEVDGLEERLKSRFGWGLTVAIEPRSARSRAKDAPPAALQLIGWLSDGLAAVFQVGTESLRWALLFLASGFWVAWHLAASRSTILADIAAAS